MSNILEVKDLNVSYGGIKAVKEISFQVPKGQVVTLIGANGAGKSSTLRSIVGLVKPESGRIRSCPVCLRTRSSPKASRWCRRDAGYFRI